jgi:hypothetical protein
LPAPASRTTTRQVRDQCLLRVPEAGDGGLARPGGCCRARSREHRDRPEHASWPAPLGSIGRSTRC